MTGDIIRLHLTDAQTRLLRDCVEWGELGPEAEEVSGVRGAAFRIVFDSLVNRGLLTDAGRPTLRGHREIDPNFVAPPGLELAA